jgi:uncharacterized protein YprB with RNaseH-like and TPR domain
VSKLAETLAKLAERRVRGASAPAPAATAANGTPEHAPGHARRKRSIVREDVGVESFLPGGVLEGAFGRVFLHERLRSEIEKPRKGWGKFKLKLSKRAFLHDELGALADRGLAGCVYLDLETGGLSNSPVFLAGTMHWNGTDFVVKQFFARDYAEEAALVDELARFLAGFETVISYNGKSYDVPFLGDRANVHGVRFTPPARHVDLLHHARRKWKGEFANCRLVTLETHVCGRQRFGDVPSDEVPGLWHDIVQYGAAHRLVPGCHPTLLDVITMDEILRALVEDPVIDAEAFQDL